MPLIKAPAGVLEVETLWQNDNPNDAATDTMAVLCHPNPLFEGTMNNKVVTTMYRFARDAGMHVVRFNFRGVGQSTGDHDYAVGEVEDALTVIQWATAQSNARKIWLGGFSFGGYVTARVAEQLLTAPQVWGLEDITIRQVALIAPSVEKNDTSDLTLPTDKTFEIYGNQDEVIAPASMQDFAEKMGLDVSIIDGAGHFFHGKLGELKKLLEQYYANR
ncbi:MULTISPECIES: alpha/beta hydrolase [Psychrobacter]|uniref:alpha/beta hydrolase n=1 Tax=Psychrobacter TaxID=497 RepID=UPI00146DEFB2|nr:MULTISPECIES: alpha/beta fold hydrolase [Psychrobacter]